MLIRFSVENFLSFNERETFSLLPGKGTLKSHHKSKPVNGISALKTAVMYGANASGKSNFVKAVDFARTLILKGTENRDSSIVFSPFKLGDDTSKNSRMQFEIQIKGKNYAYGFVFNNKEIVEEWLFEISLKSETKIFERRENNQFFLENLIKKNNSNEESQFLNFTAKATRRNQLLLTEIRKRNVSDNVSDISDLTNVINWFKDVLTVNYPHSDNSDSKFRIMGDKNFQSIISTFLSYFVDGISGIVFEKIDFDSANIPHEALGEIKDRWTKPDLANTALYSNSRNDDYYILTKSENGDIEVESLKIKHSGLKGKTELFELKEESDGTRRILDLIPLLIDLMSESHVFIIDEMERSLHPNLMYDLFDFFLSSCEYVNSQLIIATHESRLLTQKLLRRDEIWFVQKEKTGVSRLYSLAEYKRIRFDKEIEKDYLLGRYNAVPKFGSRSELEKVLQLED